jgi:hypothetical protein
VVCYVRFTSTPAVPERHFGEQESAQMRPRDGREAAPDDKDLGAAPSRLSVLDVP